MSPGAVECFRSPLDPPVPLAHVLRSSHPIPSILDNNSECEPLPSFAFARDPPDSLENFLELVHPRRRRSTCPWWAVRRLLKSWERIVHVAYPYSIASITSTLNTKRVLPESSREAKFSGVPKDNCAARGLGARVLAIPFRMVRKPLVAEQGPRAQARAPGLARVKIKSRDDHVEQKCWYSRWSSIAAYSDKRPYCRYSGKCRYSSIVAICRY